VNTLLSRCRSSSAALRGWVAFGLAALAQDPPSRTVWDGVYTQDQATRGQTLYNKECAACHGPALSGGEEAPALSGGAFTANWNGLTVGDLFERVRVSMPEGRPGTLSRQQNADILAYILSGNQFPAGNGELVKETELLKQIKFEAVKPAK
jgi:mono/diheme cytochrome c family protein